MKLLAVFILILAALLEVLGSPSPSLDLSVVADSPSGEVNELANQETVDQVAKQNQLTGERGGRILATYGQRTAQNTEDISKKLDGLTSTFVNVSSEIKGLQTSMNQSDTQVLDKLEQVHTALIRGSDLVNSLTQMSQVLGNVSVALTDSTNINTLPGQIASLNSLLTARLNSIEKIIGYDEVSTRSGPQ